MVGLVVGQLTFSLDMREQAKARQQVRVEGATVGSDDNLRRLGQLQRLGYVDGTVDARRHLRGAVHHDRERAWPGLELSSSRIRDAASLTDNAGHEGHRWQLPGDDGWEHVELLPNGSTLVTEFDRGHVFELTPGKEVVWRFLNPDFRDETLRIAIWRMTLFSHDQLSFLD